MATKTLISKIGKIDFFAVLPSGTYTFLSLYLLLGLDHKQRDVTESAWSSLEPLVHLTHDKPSVIILILFCAYVLGSILRAVPVTKSENFICDNKNEFPYGKTVKEMFDSIKTHHRLTHVETELIPELTNGLPKHVYNCWKDIVCVCSPEGFAFFQEFEARTRFFAGMFLAGCIGIVCAPLTSLVVGSILYKPALYLFIVSVIITLLYGRNLQHVRMQEVTTLAGLFLAYVQDNKSSVAKSLSKENPPGKTESSLPKSNGSQTRKSPDNAKRGAFPTRLLPW
jgi:hypothetical protein